MGNSRLILHASNIHCGGGQILLEGLIKSLPEHSLIIIDSRFPDTESILTRFNVRKVKPTLWARLRNELWLKVTVRSDDKMLCFGNLPPLFSLKCRVYVFLQNRYLLDKKKLATDLLRTHIRTLFERLWFRLFVGHADKVIVQTESMRALLKSRFSTNSYVLPFFYMPASFDNQHKKTEFENQIYDFVYVAAGYGHKNHRLLVEAWCLLADEGLFPTLNLTIDHEIFHDLCRWIDGKKALHKLNIHNMGELSHDEVMRLYNQSRALIYPSTLESFGLPLIEAKQAGLPVLAAELDYVRDVINPDVTFDPGSAVSIARAVKRFMGIKESPLDLSDPREFLNQVINKLE